MPDTLGPYELGRVHQADCLEAMRALPDGCVDAVVTDPPYGTTRNEWDRPVSWPSFFREAWRVLTNGGPVVALVDFNTAYEMRRAEWPVDRFRFEMVWSHNLPTGHLNAKIRPMLAHLFLVVFCRESPPWFPQMRPPYRAQGFSQAPARGSAYGKHHRTITDTSLGGWPTTVLTFPGVHPSIRDHASEKPVELAEWMIRSFTNPGKTICDPFSGGGWQGMAAHRTGRSFLGFDSDPASVDLANRRIIAEQERLGEVSPSDAKPLQQVGMFPTVRP